MKTKRVVKKRIKMSKFEKILYAITIILVTITPLSIIFAQATLSEINYKVERTKKEIARQQKKNESLQMKIDELASLDKIKQVAKENELTYKNDNIQNVK